MGNIGISGQENQSERVKGQEEGLVNRRKNFRKEDMPALQKPQKGQTR